jgi:hypothetical protein
LLFCSFLSTQAGAKSRQPQVASDCSFVVPLNSAVVEVGNYMSLDMKFVGANHRKQLFPLQ